MASRALKALGRIASFFAGTWGAIGVGVGMIGGASLGASLATFGVMFGAVGGISGLLIGLLVARGEAGRSLDQIKVWRVSTWGFLGGAGPALAVALIDSVTGWPLAAVVPLLIVAAVNGGLGATLSGSAIASAKTQALSSRGSGEPQLPAT